MGGAGSSPLYPELGLQKKVWLAGRWVYFRLTIALRLGGIGVGIWQRVAVRGEAPLQLLISRNVIPTT